LKNFKKIAAIMLAGAMTLTVFSGCGKKNVKLSDTNHIFTQTEITVPGNYENIQDSEYVNGKFYLLTRRSETKIVPIPDNSGGGMVAPAVPMPIVSIAAETTAAPASDDDLAETEEADETESDAAFEQLKKKFGA
jgi:hypothetical protein